MADKNFVGAHPGLRHLQAMNEIVHTDAPRGPGSETQETSPAETHAEILKRMPTEIGGPKGPEPTRYGDWEQKGRCTDF